MTLRQKILPFAITAGIALYSGALQADTLSQMFDLAQANDPQLRAAEASYKIGKESIVSGRSALLPQVSSSAGYTSSITSEPSVLDQSGDGSDWRVTASQTLFDLTAWYRYKASALDTASAESGYEQDKQAAILRVTQAYFEILKAIDTLETTLAEEKAVNSQLEQVKLQFEVGLIAITDVQEAQAAYDDILARKLAALGNLGVAFENMTVLTGQEHLSIAPLKADFPIMPPEPLNVDEWVNLTLQNNPELEAAEYNKEIAEYNKKSAIVDNHLPVPTVEASYSYSNDNRAFAYNSNPNEGAAVEVTVTLPIFQGGANLSDTRVAYERVTLAKENYNLKYRSLVQDTRSSHLLVRTNVAQVTASKQSLLSSQTALEATRAGYEVGTRNLVDLLQAEKNLRQAERNYYNARYSYILNLLSLKQAAGILNAEDVRILNNWLDTSNEIPRSRYPL